MFPLWGHVKGLMCCILHLLCKSLWEVKTDSLQWCLCPEISLQSSVPPNLAVHIHDSKACNRIRSAHWDQFSSVIFKHYRGFNDLVAIFHA